MTLKVTWSEYFRNCRFPHNPLWGLHRMVQKEKISTEGSSLGEMDLLMPEVSGE